MGEIKRDIVAKSASWGERHLSLSSPRDDLRISDLYVAGVSKSAAATVQSVLQNPRHICDVCDAKYKSFFRGEAIHRLSSVTHFGMTDRL